MLTEKIEKLVAGIDQLGKEIDEGAVELEAHRSFRDGPHCAIAHALDRAGYRTECYYAGVWSPIVDFLDVKLDDIPWQVSNSIATVAAENDAAASAEKRGAAVREPLLTLRKHLLGWKVQLDNISAPPPQGS